MYNNAQRYIFMPEYPPLMLVEPIADMENFKNKRMYIPIIFFHQK